MPTPLEYIYVIAIGLVVGSFLNVCIYRLPRGKSIVFPPSACPACGTAIKPWQNIPLISYVFLRGRCASCGAGISIRYPAVELLNGLLYTAAFYKFGVSFMTPAVMALLSALVVVTFIDIEHKIIPDGITLPGIAIGLVMGPAVFKTGILGSVIGMVAGGGVLLLVGFLGELIMHKEGMGGGDVKLMAMLGAFLGWKTVLIIIFIGSFLGSATGLLLIIFNVIKRENYIPFGPFLAAGAVIAIFYGDRLTRWYVGL
ncbi:MAG: prepilin peptidase [Nitrospirota bacterium]